MIRIKIDALECKGGLYFLNQELFGGIGYQVSGPQVVAAYLIEQGQLSTKLNSTIFPEIEASGIIDDFLEWHEEHYNGEPFSFNDEPYTGLAYEFWDQYCVCEQWYLDGHSNRAIEWYKSGNIASYDIWDEDVSQDIEWFENGQPKFVRYVERDVFRMSFRLNENGLTKFLCVSGDYFGRLAVLKDKLKVNHIDMDYIQHHLVADESIYMSGDGINDEIFRLVADSDGLSRTKELRLFNTSISEESIDLLERLTHLSRISFEKKNELGIKDALIRLKKANPSLAIEFNRARLRL